MVQETVSSHFKDIAWTPPLPGASAQGRARRFGRAPRPAPSGDALTVELIAASSIDDALRAEWRALGKDAESPNPYFEYWFLEPALAHLDLKREVRLCTIRQQDGCLVGLVPLVLQAGYAKLPLKHLAVWVHRHCYNATPLIARGMAERIYGALIDLIDTRPAGACFLRFQHLPWDAKASGALSAACAARHRHPREQERYQRAILTGGQDFDTVMKAAMSGKKRKELRRQAKRFADLGDTAFAGLPVDDSVVDAFVALENAGWKNDDPDGYPFARCIHEAAFFREAMIAGSQEKAVECTALTLDDTPAAMLLSLRSGECLSAFKTAYDEGHSAYSPGFRLIMEATRRMLDRHEIGMFDSCARQGHPVVDRLWPQRLPIVQINVPGARAADKAMLGLAATLEKLKLAVLSRLAKNKKDGD